MKVTHHLLISIFILALISCSSEKHDVSKMWLESVAYFDNGRFDEALEIAKSIRKYDANSSDYLIGQYAIYGAAARGLPFDSGLETAYNGLLSLNLNVDSTYKGHYIAAQVFAQVFLRGRDAAATLFATDCKIVANSVPSRCEKYLLRDALNSFAVSHGRLEAIYLYEISKIGFDLNLVSKPLPEFYMALSLVRIDDSRAIAIFRGLNVHGLLNADMKNVYCGFVQDMRVKERAFSCGQ